MYMRLWMGAATLVGLAGSAWAQHHHVQPDSEHSEGPHHELGAGLAVVAATFDTKSFVGNYQGVLPSVQWSRSRFGIAASTGVYRVEENGADFYAFGDVLVHGRVAIGGNGRTGFGAIAGVSAPTGDSRRGTGMGHVMVMPALYAMASRGKLSGNASLGYSRALGGEMDHDHGPWPLVEPMLMSEVSWSAGADVTWTSSMSTGLHIGGGIPAGAAGDNRVTAGARFAWHTGRVESAAEIQAGLAGDPFTVRGVVSTALSF
jgi:hypothetical protein